MKQILNAPLIATMFQESYKNTVAKGQTDLQFRFWNEENGQVDTRYNTSDFLGKSFGVDICEKFNSCCSKLLEENITQVGRQKTLLHVFIKVQCCSRLSQYTF